MSEISFDTSNPAFHEGAWEVFLNSGCPPTLAYQAAQVIGRDNAYLKNLGRSKVDQEIIDKTLPYLQVKEI
ncbi:hypothetical protein [Mastigocoleus testarum]|uniref:Uncharacterized protein n=1 Tax=Mastigocoleus testarum BC008 TaxID=371196 RepID=A0A0V7ZGE3_9CYAN|nr:hypothetical protein [Mastigocoleus testarum]KST63522.1 hypothetical protein BC008_13745 [Mastigocoleus testarum BC008]